MTSSGLQTLWVVLPGLGHSESKQKQRWGNRGEERRGERIKTIEKEQSERERFSQLICSNWGQIESLQLDNIALSHISLLRTKSQLKIGRKYFD